MFLWLFSALPTMTYSTETQWLYSSEQTLMSTTCCLYKQQRRVFFPRLLLFYAPDKAASCPWNLHLLQTNLWSALSNNSFSGSCMQTLFHVMTSPAFMRPFSAAVKLFHKLWQLLQPRWNCTKHHTRLVTGWSLTLCDGWNDFDIRLRIKKIFWREEDLNTHSKRSDIKGSRTANKE